MGDHDDAADYAGLPARAEFPKNSVPRGRMDYHRNAVLLRAVR